MISIVIPAYNEEKNIIQTIIKIQKILEKKSKFEIIVIDDGSTDSTWEVYKKYVENFSQKNFKGIKFTRNFGKESAIYAGLKKAVGDAVITIDADGQHPPELILEMIKYWSKGFEIVDAIKIQRQKENFFKSLMAYIFFKIFKILTNLDIKNLTDYKLLSKKAVKIYLNLQENRKFYRGLINWTGLKTKKIYFTPLTREKGSSSWKLQKLFSLAWESIISFSRIPLRLLFITGLISFVFSIILILQTLYMKLSGKSIEGFTTIILLQLFFGSGIILGLGIIGEYIGQIYEEIKRRPLFIIEDEF